MRKSIYILLKQEYCFGRIISTIVVICSFFTSQTVVAQTDSLFNTNIKNQFKNNNNIDEIKINEEAIKLIKFDFMPSLEEDLNKPLDAPLEKAWMKFRQDLNVPKNLTDTTKVRKPEGFIRMLPYSIWTKFGEDPVYDVMVFGNQKKYTMNWGNSFNPFRNFGDNYGLSMPVSAGMISDGMRIQGTGFAIGGLDIMGFFYYNFTKHGRTLKHNQKHANAWKSYIGYQPTLSDSLKLPTFYNGLLVPIFNYNPKDSAHTASPIVPFEELPDSVRYEIEMVISTKRDSLRTEYLEKENQEADKERKAQGVKKSSMKEVREAKKARKEKEKKAQMEEKMIEDLPDNMDDLYKFMREKNAREAKEREKKRKERELRID